MKLTHEINTLKEFHNREVVKFTKISESNQVDLKGYEEDVSTGQMIIIDLRRQIGSLQEALENRTSEISLIDNKSSDLTKQF